MISLDISSAATPDWAVNQHGTPNRTNCNQSLCFNSLTINNKRFISVRLHELSGLGCLRIVQQTGRLVNQYYMEVGMAISDWPVDERPREKLLHQGASALSDAELLAIFLRTGFKGVTAVDLARQLLVSFGGLRAIIGADIETFCAHLGLGQAKFVQLQAVMEMAQRNLSESLQKGSVINDAVTTRQFLQAKLRAYTQEVFACLYLDSQHRMINYLQHFFGTVDSASVYPRELVKSALQQNASAVILAHNHPSGEAEPSEADRSITRHIKSAMELIDVRVVDHIVIGNGEVVSFAERGWL